MYPDINSLDISVTIPEIQDYPNQSLPHSLLARLVYLPQIVVASYFVIGASIIIRIGCITLLTAISWQRRGEAIRFFAGATKIRSSVHAASVLLLRFALDIVSTGPSRALPLCFQRSSDKRSDRSTGTVR